MDMEGVSTEPNAGALFLGFMVGSILFGVAILQAYQYFMNYNRDSKRRKLMVVATLILDTLHIAFSAILVYLSITTPLGFSGNRLLWTFKGFATVKTSIIVLVQCYYLVIIWQFARSFPLSNIISNIIQLFAVVLFTYAITMGITFLVYLEEDKKFFDFSGPFKKVIYVSFGSTAVIDSAIAGTLSFLLFKTDPGRKMKSRGVIRFLVLFFVGTGLMTAVMSITTISVYASWPSTVLYLSIEFAVPSLYTNSILALFNSKTRLQQRMNSTTELKLSSLLLFDEACHEQSPIAEIKSQEEA